MTEFYVIATIFNPSRYQSRYRLYEAFCKHVAAAGATLVTIELAFQDQPFVVTESKNRHHIQLRSDHHIWYKENLVNVAIRRLPPAWTHAAWLDADIAFARPDWLQQTVLKLERHPFVQMFTHALDLGPKYEPLKSYEGFAYKRWKTASALDGQPGYAWAARREAFEAVGGLIDWSILGSNDHFMARGMVGAIDPQATRMPGSNYANKLLAWQDRACEILAGDLGFVETTLLHYWHGRRADRGYDSRWRILVDNDFDPDADLLTRPSGLLELAGNKPKLGADIRAYFQSRNEDNTEL